MKQRIAGKVEGGEYVVRGLRGEVIKSTPLAEARSDPKHQAAIKRNGWEAIPDG